jgi:hypothetical protein
VAEGGLGEVDRRPALEGVGGVGAASPVRGYPGAAPGPLRHSATEAGFRGVDVLPSERDRFRLDRPAA